MRASAPRLAQRIDWQHAGEIQPAQARAIGESLCARIRARTQSGRDIHSFPFQPYGAEYARRTGKTTVDLTSTGQMLGALAVLDADQTSVLIGIDGAPAIRAAAHNAGTETQPQREFLGLTSADQDFTLREVLRYQALNFLRGRA